MAQSLADLGYDTLFVTTPLSPFSRFTHEKRWDYCSASHLNKIEPVSPNLSMSVYSPLYTPISLTGNPLVDLLFRPLGRIYGARTPSYLSSWIGSADLIIFESTASILLFEAVKAINPEAKIVYRVSDALESLLPQPWILMYEKEISPFFYLISVPSRFLYDKFASFHPSLHYHGIDKSLFETRMEIPSSFGTHSKNMVFIGNAYVDDTFIRIASELFPQFGFHIIGPVKTGSNADNVISYGELPFLETIPYLQHADAGLHTLRYSNSLASYSDSLKVIQYTWCRLPIIAPDSIPSERAHMHYYHYDDPQSIRRSIETALRFDRQTVDRSGIYDWKELTSKILAEVSL